MTYLNKLVKKFYELTGDKAWKEHNERILAEIEREKNKDKDRVLDSNITSIGQPLQQDIFEYIYGHEGLKAIFNNAITNDEPVHILLTGAPGTAKTLFLEAVGYNIKDAKFITNNATGPGILNVLYEHENLKYLCIDEIEKIPKDQIAV